MPSACSLIGKRALSTLRWKRAFPSKVTSLVPLLPLTVSHQTHGDGAGSTNLRLLTSGALAKPGARSGTHNLLKCAGEMARVGKADERCDRCQRLGRIVHHESLRASDASVHLPTLKRHAGRVLERSAKLRG